jgi:hypothetical protein
MEVYKSQGTPHSLGRYGIDQWNRTTDFDAFLGTSLSNAVSFILAFRVSELEMVTEPNT